MVSPIEVGIVFRGFVLVSHEFKEGSKKLGDNDMKDLRGAFISAINLFISSAFHETSLEYLESGNYLFIFTVSEILPRDCQHREPVILYGLVERNKRNPDKIVKRFIHDANPILQLFVQRFHDSDFSSLDTFTPFKNEIIEFFKK